MVMDVNRHIVVIIWQYIQKLNHHLIHLKLIYQLYFNNKENDRQSTAWEKILVKSVKYISDIGQIHTHTHTHRQDWYPEYIKQSSLIR